MARLIAELFGKSPFGPVVGHTKKVHACVKLVRPLMEATIKGDYEEVHRLQDEVSRLEYEADVLKHEIREQLPNRFFLPVDRAELDRFLHCQDGVADGVEDYAVILQIRNTRIHPALAEQFLAYVDQVVKVVDSLMAVGEELETLVETSFGGAEAKSVVERIVGLGEEEWAADRMQRKIYQRIYAMENDLDPVTIIFYEKILTSLSAVASSAENAGELVRIMIVRR